MNRPSDGAPPADWPNRQFSQRVQAANLDWHVQTGGVGPLVVLLHGTGSSAHTWAPLWPLLLPHATLLAPDLPGHGFTQGADFRALDLRSMAHQLDALLDALGLGAPALVVGHSAGLPLALRWALLTAHGPQGIVGFAPSLVPPPPAYSLFLGPLINPLATSGPMARLLANLSGPSGMVDRLLDSTGTLLGTDQRRCYRTLFAQARHVRGAMNFMAAADLPSLLADAQALDIPMTLVIGERDTWVPATALRGVLARNLPRAHLIHWDAGHLMHEAEPERAARVILQALSPTSAGHSQVTRSGK